MDKAAFRKKLKEYKIKIDSRLDRFLMERVRRATMISDQSGEMMENIREFNLRGGKRIRPILVMIGYEAITAKKKDAIIDAALAVELMESFLLIHDDIIDLDRSRRGGMTLHRIFYEKAKADLAEKLAKDPILPDALGKDNDWGCGKQGRADLEHYGNSMAILAGDIAAILGSEAILGSNFSDKKKILAADKFNKVVMNTTIGQILDISSQHKQVCCEEDILHMHKLKTAIYTIEGPLHIGAILAGAGAGQLKDLSTYAISLGQAFQIKDDILGVFGDQAKIGKPVGSDIREGKKTLLVLKALENASEPDRKLILQCLGKNNLTDKDIDKFREMIVQSGSLAYSESLCRKKAQKAISAIKKANIHADAKDFLVGLAHYIIEREF